MVHGWRKFAHELDIAAARPAPSAAAVSARPAASMPQFVPVKLTHTTPAPVSADIQIELRRGATAVKITWPVAVAADCAAWMRELLR